MSLSKVKPKRRLKTNARFCVDFLDSIGRDIVSNEAPIIYGTNNRVTGKYGVASRFDGSSSRHYAKALETTNFAVHLVAKFLGGTVGWNRLVSSKSAYGAYAGFEITLYEGASDRIDIRAGGGSAYGPTLPFLWSDNLYHRITVHFYNGECYLYADNIFVGSAGVSQPVSSTNGISIADNAIQSEIKFLGDIALVAVTNGCSKSTVFEQHINMSSIYVLTDFEFYGTALLDTIPPTLTNPTGTATGSTSASGTVNTDEANGDAWKYTSTSATPPSQADHETGTGAAAWVSATVIATGTIPFADSTGLNPSTTYYNHYLHKDPAGNYSSQVTSSSFITDAVTNINASLATTSISALEAGVNAEKSVVASVSALSIATYQATITTGQNTSISASTASAAISGLQSGVNAKKSIAATTSALSITTYQAYVSIGVTIAASTSGISAATYQATITNIENVNVAANYASLGFSTYQATITATVDTWTIQTEDTTGWTELTEDTTGWTELTEDTTGWTIQ